MKDNGLILILESDQETFFPLLVIMYMDLVIREVATTQEDHKHILAYANAIAQTNQSTQEEEIKNRIAKYSQNVGCMNRLLNDRNVPKKDKQIIRQTIVRPILIFE